MGHFVCHVLFFLFLKIGRKLVNNGGLSDKQPPQSLARNEPALVRVGTIQIASPGGASFHSCCPFEFCHARPVKLAGRVSPKEHG